MVSDALPRDPVELEELARGKQGRITLAEVFRIIRDRWRRGERERELGLHLIFLSWYGMIEPPFIFGETHQVDNLLETFHEVRRHFEAAVDDDPELLYVIGLPLSMWPWMFGDEGFWEETAQRYRARYRELVPEGLAPSTFAGRGEFGEYYAHQVGVEGGF